MIFFVAIGRLGDIGSRPRQIQACDSLPRGLHVSRLACASQPAEACASIYFPAKSVDSGTGGHEIVRTFALWFARLYI